MKKGLKLTLIIIIILIGLVLLYTIKAKAFNDKIKRHNEIKESLQKAVEWNIKAQYPKCMISTDFDENLKAGGSHYNASFLIGNGYIKQSELLDIDEKSYCDAFVNIKVKYENELDHQKNCLAMYKIYLKCHDYQDDGYDKWDK